MRVHRDFYWRDLAVTIRLNLVAGIAVAIVCLTGAPSAVADGHESTPSARLGAVGVNVADLARAEKFYKEVFELERVFQFPPEGDNIIELGLTRAGSDGATLILARLNDNALPDGKASYGRLIFFSDDARTLGKRATDRGSKLREIPGSGDNSPVILFFTDPDGYEIEVYQAPAQ